ncbi:MAG: methyltransferase domain-containing protein [Gammaproteobacteria bacterium]|nr:methyltransferase domain-containing protein [Gammaproteobacteria bacterium]
MSLPFALPPIIEGGATPVWVMDGFQIGSEFTKVLQYSLNDSGWNDDLTLFHEESAGDQHFIDQASRLHALGELKKHVKQPNPTILEVGCSSGFMLEEMQKAFPDATIIGSDVVNSPLKKLAEKIPHVPLLRFDMVHCPLPDNSIDAIVMLNVLEHIEDDAGALAQAMRVLKPGGTLIIEVPAGPHLYDAYDKILMHYRRYRLSSFCKLLENAGFQILKRSHLGVFLYPGFWLVKQMNKRRLSESEAISRQKVDTAIRKTGSNKLMNAIMQLELRLGRFLSYPTGIRCLVSCVKADKKT